MPDTTPIFGFPFPEDSDPTDVPGDIEALALAVETDLDTVSDGLAAHLADTTDAHDASAISTTALTGISATNVQAVLAELIAEAFPVGWGAWTPWTPTLTQGVVVSKTVSRSVYMKIGRTVHLIVDLGPTSSGTAGQPIVISNLPFVSAYAGGQVGTAKVFDASAGDDITGLVRFPGTNNTLNFLSTRANGVLGSVTFTAALTTSDQVAFHATYEAST